MEGSIVAMEKKVCPACGKLHETGNLLMTQSMKHLFHKTYAINGFEVCEDCKKIAIENNGVWFSEIIDTKESIGIQRSFLMKMSVLDNAEEGHKEFAKENHWIAIDKETANNFENTFMGDKNGKE